MTQQWRVVLAMGKTDALTETNIFVPQKWMVGALWSNIVFFWVPSFCHPGSCHVSYAPMAGLPGGVQKTPRWLANPCTVDVWRHRWISCPRCVLSLTCDWTACFFSDLHLRRWSFAPFSYMLGELTSENPQKNGGGVSNRILPMKGPRCLLFYTSFFVVKSCWKLSAQPKKAMILPRRALVMNVISKVVRRRMQVQGYVHGQSKQLNLSVKDSTTVENAVSFW